ncbi:hypothetical protein RvY_07664 [Ramazzottius varieornatus]|uniref:Elongator complex protein 4 n=1 Tax=Ramazzottius varieornatus TaxID=947166 RepID=A0A1D1V304_RAMVA|nr:hypothetical protein RvY_07664 [Ramazzottius varieornatus]
MFPSETATVDGNPIRTGGATFVGMQSPLSLGQQIVSSGCTGLNQILGGGIPVGSVLVFQDKPWIVYSDRFLHVVAAEGLAAGHSVAVAVPPNSRDSQSFVSLIPSAGKSQARNSAEKDKTNLRRHDDNLDANVGGSDEDLRIAWRYKDIPKVNPVLGSSSHDKTTHKYDLGVKLDVSEVADIAQFFSPGGTTNLPDALISWIQEQSTKCGTSRTLRVVLPDIDSPLWGFHGVAQFCQFLFRLKNHVRSTSTIVCLSISHDLHERSDLRSIRRLSDAYLAIEVLGDDVRSHLYPDFQAICRIEKAFTINSLRPPPMTDHEFGLKIKKRRITIERLHLPPELQDSVQRETSNAKKSTGGGLNCQTVRENDLDF